MQDNDPRLTKVYKVTFGRVEDDTDYMNETSQKVLARDVNEAIKVAAGKYEDEDKKHLYPQEVEVITALD